MIRKPGIRAVIRGLGLLLPAVIATWLMRVEVVRLMCEHTMNTAEGLRAAVLHTLEQAPSATDPAAQAVLYGLVSIPELAGIEIYSPEGRRIWSLGEALEIVGYRLGQDRSLTHIAEKGTRYEIYWPAQALGAEVGLALRLDTGWQDPLRRRVTTHAFLLSLGLVFLVAWLASFRRRVHV